MDLLYEICLFFLKAGAFSFGGGYGVLYMLQNEIVYQKHWISPEAFVDIVAIAEMTPGPIAVNASTFVGYTLLGPLAGVLATLCIVAVPFVLSLTVSVFYGKFKDNCDVRGALKGIRPAVVGLVAAVSLGIAQVSLTDGISTAIFILGAALLFRWKIHPIAVMLLSGFLGIFLYSGIFAVGA